MTRTTKLGLKVGVVSLTLAVAVMAWAHGPMGGFGDRGPHGNFGGGGPLGLRPGGSSGGLLQELIFPCQGDCVSSFHTCSDTADSAALMCIGAACETEIQAAQDACATERTQGCQDALTALRTCAQSCLSTRQMSLLDCANTLRSCRQGCTAPTPTPTPS